MSSMSTQGSDVTTDFPITDSNSTIFTDSLERWHTLIELLSPTYPDIHQLMTIRNTSTNKTFIDLWNQMRNLYLKSMDSTDNASWETFKDFLGLNMLSIPFLGLDDILTVMTGVTQFKLFTDRAATPNLSSPSHGTLKRPADETIYMSSTHAPFPIEVADAASLETILEGPINVYDAGTSRQPTSEISCSTSIHGHTATTSYRYLTGTNQAICDLNITSKNAVVLHTKDVVVNTDMCEYSSKLIETYGTLVVGQVPSATFIQPSLHVGLQSVQSNAPDDGGVAAEFVNASAIWQIDTEIIMYTTTTAASSYGRNGQYDLVVKRSDCAPAYYDNYHTFNVLCNDEPKK